MLVPERRWKVGPGKVIAASIMTSRHLLVFKEAVKERFDNEEAKQDLDEVLVIMNRLMEEWKITKKQEAGRKKVGPKATSDRDAGNSGKSIRKRRGLLCVVFASKTTTRMPVNGCWR